MFVPWNKSPSAITMSAMRKPVILITGANGEMGHGLFEYLGQSAGNNIVAIDLNPFDKALVK